MRPWFSTRLHFERLKMVSTLQSDTTTIQSALPSHLPIIVARIPGESCTRLASCECGNRHSSDVVALPFSSTYRSPSIVVSMRSIVPVTLTNRRLSSAAARMPFSSYRFATYEASTSIGGAAGAAALLADFPGRVNTNPAAATAATKRAAHAIVANAEFAGCFRRRYRASCMIISSQKNLTPIWEDSN